VAEGYKLQADLFRALGHPVRLRILEILAREEACVCHLTHVLRRRQAYVSQQLAVLRDAGLITSRRDGWNIYYRVTDARVLQLIDLAKEILMAQRGKGEITFAPLPPLMARGCPCPRCRGCR